MAVKNVAIIGCGVAGLTSIKSCIDAGLKPTCFEQQSSYGGVWNYTDESRPNLATVHSSTVTNLSKLITGFSDFPFPKEFPNYLPHRLVQEYLKMYVEKFDLLKYVQFNTEVVKLERSADYGETGKWVVSTRYKVFQNLSYQIHIMLLPTPQIANLSNAAKAWTSTAHLQCLLNMFTL